MSDTAKKLREAADYTKDYSVVSTMAIARVRDDLGLGKTDTFATDLGAVLDTIADELDELQARAAGANNLRQQLESAEKKAERRKRHIGYLETALHDKNALLEQRGGTIARLTAECSELRKQVPTERERQILDMWPRFEDGEYVWFGDAYIDADGDATEVRGIEFEEGCTDLVGIESFHTAFWAGERVKRPAPKVLDADGVEIKVGDTVWMVDGVDDELLVEKFHDGQRVDCLSVYGAHEGSFINICSANLTHTRADSWGRLEVDAQKNACDYFGVECDSEAKCRMCPHFQDDRDCSLDMNADIVRRAKKLAGVD